MASKVNFEWFDANWERLKHLADESLSVQAQRYINRHPSCTMIGAMKIIDALNHLVHNLNHIEYDLAPTTREEVKLLTDQEVNHILGVEHVHGIFFCRKCKTPDHTTYSMQQTRGGDEGMTVFVTCNQCGNKWKR